METRLPRQKLSIGIQTFAKLREENCYYVDKTPFALQLIAQGSAYFLSRPRRFGKSLFLDTLKELFEGNRALFQGLYAEQHWDWSSKYPVIRLSFGGGMAKSLPALEALIHEQLLFFEEKHLLPAVLPDIPSRLKRLLQGLYTKHGQRVVVLVDEYDKPILDNLNEPAQARIMRDALRDVYSILKDSDAYLKFVFITGVSKFSKVSLFSGLNNLNDVTVDAAYSAICGYTEQDVDSVFAPELCGLERDHIRRWYNGYNWRGEAVYNPFDLLLLFQKREFRPFWFETGTPTFLVDFLRQRQWFTPDLTALQTTEALLSRFDVDEIAPEALLWQTGYLTFHKVEELLPGQWFFTLTYPNREVESALNDALLPAYGPTAHSAVLSRSGLIQALKSRNLTALRDNIHALFAGIPHDWYRKNALAQFEGHYASIFYSQFAALGLDVRGEDVTNHGRIDISLKLDNQVYLFEFKVTGVVGGRASLTNSASRAVEQVPEGKALQQLLDKGYAEKYRAPGVEITLIGVEFSRVERNLVGWETLLLPAAAP